MWPFIHEEDRSSQSMAGALAGMACATLLVYLFAQAPSQEAMRPTRRDIAPLTPSTCTTTIQSLQSAARMAQTPIWIWVDEAFPAPGDHTAGPLSRVSRERPSPTKPAPYAFPDDEAPLVEPCRFERNAVHILVRGDGSALPATGRTAPRPPHPAGGRAE